MAKAQLEYGAISIDSNIMFSLGYKFDAGMLEQLKQFKNRHVVVIQPRIIHNEMVKHVSEPFEKLHNEIEKIRKESVRKLKVDDALAIQATQTLKGELDATDLAEKLISAFYQEVNGEVLETQEFLDVNELVDLYFHSEPPFENNKEKKSEFPDAIALLCLEAWAAKQNFKVVAVSNDKGWSAFADTAGNVEVVDDLQSALAIFQPHQRAMEIIESLLGNDFLDEGERLFSEIKESVSNTVSDSYDLTIEASSALMFEYDEVSVEFDDMRILQKLGKTEPIDLIRIEDDEITLSINVEIQCSVTANFSFYIEDSLDRDMVSLGNSSETTSETFNTVLLVSLSGDFSESLDNIELINVEMQGTIDSANFGNIEPYYEPDIDEGFDYYERPDSGDSKEHEF